ncbi:MAG TPA: hypothetical protein VGR48_08215 [Terriglobales bacterium]|nr:hypothetical protein [Terriglobales bacterium]
MAEPRATERMYPPEMKAVKPERELPAAKAGVNPRLNETAHAIGSALGSATRQVQNMRERFTVIRGGAQDGRSTAEHLKATAQQKVQEIKERARTAVEQARTEATSKLEEARATAAKLMQEAKESAAERARMVRLRAARLTDERPLAVLAGIGVAALLVGVFLRVGRRKRG